MRYFVVAAISFIILSFGHILGIRGFYYTIYYYDDILHFLFGAMMGLVIFLFLKQKIQKENLPFKKTFYFTFIFCTGITLGVFWEFFEFIWVFWFGSPSNILPVQIEMKDIFSDLFFDGIGLVLIILIIYFREKPYTLVKCGRNKKILKF